MSSREAHGSGKNVKLSRKGKSSKAKIDEVVNSGDVSIVVTGVPEETSATDRTLAGRTCMSCKGPDSDEMVQCDNCDKWHHFGCVGVTEEVADHSWSCPKCVSAKWAQRSGSTSSKQLPSAYDAKDSTGTQEPKTSMGSTTKDQRSSTVDAVGGVNDGVEPRDIGKPFSKVRQQIDNKEVIISGASSALSSSSSRRSSRTLLKLQMQKLEEEKKLAKEFLERKYALLEEAASERSSKTSSRASSSLSRVRDWVHGNNKQREENMPSYPEVFDPERHSTQNPCAIEMLNQLAVPREQSFSSRQDHWTNGRTFSIRAMSSGAANPTSTPTVGICSQRTSVDRAVFATHREVEDLTRPHVPISSVVGDPYRPSCSRREPRVEEDFDDPCPLSRKQLAARQAISKDLPSFSGNPEDWPIFFSSYTNTTAMCGFTDAENTVRLQKSLTGKAYDAVKSRLMHPSNVKGVIDTLRMRFGQPEAIVHSLIAKITALPSLKEDKLETIMDFAVEVQNFCAIVDACELEEHMYNVSLLHQLVSRLPPSIKLDWAKYRYTLPRVNLATFGNWIYSLAEAASTVTIPAIQEFKPSRNDSRPTKKSAGFLNAHLESNETELKPDIDNVRNDMNGCLVCKSSCKELWKCKQFLELSRDSRWAVVRDFALCRRCLQKHNGVCKARACGKNGCTRKHHELLHNENQKENESNPKSDGCERHQPSTSSARHECNSHRSSTNNSLFRYLPVVLYGKSGCIQTFAFLDEGSKLTLMDEELANELELDGVESPLYLRWTGGTERCEKDSRAISVSIAGVYTGAKRFKLDDVRTVQGLQLPRQSLDAVKMMERYPCLRGLPIEPYEAARPRILIGLKHAHVSLVLQCREGKVEQPIAIKTRLGWTVCGGSDNENVPNMVHYSFHVGSREDHLDEDLHQAMKEYFALDSMGVMKPSHALLSLEDQRSNKMLESLTNLNGNRYETGLLWRYDDFRLPDSRPMALRRYHLLEKRMAKNPELGKALDQKIEEYIAKGYIRQLTKEEEEKPVSRVWYLPVFPVFNPNKPGKIRIVWDAAATIFGVSLNSVLLKGPDQLCSLFSILLQFREHPIGLTGDIREMFHQIQIREQDRSCQRFFWRDKFGKAAVFEMDVMTFGACCSPSSAQFVKNLNAGRFVGKYPQAVEAIIKRHYVDDMLVSVKTEKEAVDLAHQVKYIHAEGGFEIRNWISNSQLVLQSLGEDDVKSKNLDLSAEVIAEKVLGLWWCTDKDTFTYKVAWTRHDEMLLQGQRCPTKREVLRVLMSIFDPLGLIAHFLIYLKMLLQEIWRSGTQWDEEISDTLFAKWQQWLRVLPEVEGVEIPRCYHIRKFTDCELHTFVDASENGFAAVSYMRFSNGKEVECALVTAKTRVAPLKFQSIPRLELQAAVLGARLARTVAEALSIEATRRLFWTDSRDVLCWINSDHRRFTQFVAHRVSELLDSTEASEWRWVSTKENVADDATKWQGRPNLTTSSRWFKGPEFLWRSESCWPQQIEISKTTQEELRPHLVAHITTMAPAICLTNYSSWKRLVNVVGFLLRFSANCRRKLQHHPIHTGPLCMEELSAAEKILIRQAQRDNFVGEIASLTRGQQISRSSSLFKSSPFIDDSGILRMRGRTTACSFITEEAKNPIILPRDHHLTTLIINHFHNKYHHLNQDTVVNELRQKFSISRVRVSCAKVRRNCQRCKNDHAIPSAPIMADLPDARLAAYSRPFTHVGIDYFGPMEVAVGRRVEKSWGVLATCMTTRAVHIEIAHSLNTDSCIMAIRNMIARRGIPRYIYCDRGTNFVGTSRELSRVEGELDLETMMKEFTTSETAWCFNPPMSPHMGGCWERLIRSVKNSLKSLNLPRRPSDEVLRNALTEIENVINSRPLTHVPIEDNAAPALTPNHVLLGTSNGSKPLTMLSDSGTIVRQCWRTSQIIANQFWRRWIAEYLLEITRRTKWYSSRSPSVKIGDVVVIVDSTFPRNCWPKGRVIATRPGRDGEVRSATVRTATGVYERPVVKLAVLDVMREDK